MYSFDGMQLLFISNLTSRSEAQTRLYRPAVVSRVSQRFVLVCEEEENVSLAVNRFLRADSNKIQSSEQQLMLSSLPTDERSLTRAMRSSKS